jgi:P27 family predicted phage terminase small subunit
MVGGRKPTPVRLKVLLGNPGKRPLPVEPVPQTFAEIPAPPDYLQPEAAAEWRRLAPELLRLGLLTPVDLAAFASYCEAVGRWQLAVRLLAESGGKLTARGYRGRVITNPLVRVIGAAADDALRCATEFGMTPSSRARVGAGLGGKAGKFAGLLA